MVRLGLSFVCLLILWPDLVSAEGIFRVLVFSKTAGFRHASIPAGIDLIQELAGEPDFAVDTTEDATQFTDQQLAQYAAVVWLNTSGDVLDAAQQVAFQKYIETGGGFVGVHSAADTEHAWPWYGQLLGGDAWFNSHPAIQSAELDVEDQSHPSTHHYPARFPMTDEWYNFLDNPRGIVSVLITIDETTYDPGADAMGDHPISWFHQVVQGRSWYTNMGHRTETYDDPDFKEHLLGGILWAADRSIFLDGFESGDTSRWSSAAP